MSTTKNELSHTANSGSAPGDRRAGRRVLGGILLLLLGVGSMLLAGLPASADILVMKDGSRVETDGPWEVKGRMIRFTSPSGTLSAVRLSEVDIEASEAATEEANNPPPEPVAEATEAETERPAPVLVLTDADIPKGQVLEGGEEEAAAAADNATKAVRVSNWDYAPGDGNPAFELTGTIQNYGTAVAENIQVFVDLIGIGSDGQPNPDVHLLREGLVLSSTLAPGETTEFRYGVTASDLAASGDPDAFVQPAANFDVRFRLQESDSAADTASNRP